MKKLTVLIATILSLTAISFGTTAVYAEDPPQPGSGQALEIAPPVVNLKANPGETITTKINLRDVSSQTLVVTGEVNDFTAAGEDGTPKIMLDEEEDPAASPYSIRSWIAPLPELTLEPRQVKEMTVTINVPANAAPGGYYGVIRFTGTPPELEGTGVSLSASLGSLIFIRVSGDANESLAIEEFSVASNGQTGTFFESTPLQFIERLKNNGNTHLQPAGQITITDMFGQKVATVNVNLPPRNILPSSIRKFEQSLDGSTLGNRMLFGRYTADMKLTYGDKQEVVTSTITFWVIPYRLVGIIIITLIFGFFLIRTIIRRYNRRVIRRSHGGGFSIGSKRR